MFFQEYVCIALTLQPVITKEQPVILSAAYMHPGPTLHRLHPGHIDELERRGSRRPVVEGQLNHETERCGCIRMHELERDVVNVVIGSVEVWTFGVLDPEAALVSLLSP